MDASEQLQKLYHAGFELQTFERFPQAIGVVRDNCIALLESTPNGLRMIGAPGWRMGDLMGVLTEKDGRKVFQAKSEVVEATPDRTQILEQFRNDLERELLPIA
jgi:hypothetical protein